MLYVVVQKEQDSIYDTMVGIFHCLFDAEDFRNSIFDRGNYEIREVEGYWGDLINIRKEAGC